MNDSTSVVTDVDPSEPVIEARGLGQRYRRRIVFQSLDLRILPGVTAILGPNGVGKTTLLNTIVGLRLPFAGALSVLGVNVLGRDGRLAIASRLGFLPQSVGFYPRYSVRDYLSYAAWLKGVANIDLSRLVSNALERVDLDRYASQRMSTLSGGMLRRAGIAQAIVAEPALLVLDEPVAGLDPAQRIELRHLIRDVAGQCSVVISTHDIEDARHVVDRLVVLRNGKISFSGTAPELERRADRNVKGDTALERGYLSVVTGRPKRIQ